MARSTVHYADKETNNILKKLHNKLRPAGTPVQRVEYIIELLLLRIFEVKLVQDPDFTLLRAAFRGDHESLLFSSLLSLPNDEILPTLNLDFFPFYAGILSEARKVWRGNLSDKVRDQLVLIEEVFSNSNFTNDGYSMASRAIWHSITSLTHRPRPCARSRMHSSPTCRPKAGSIWMQSLPTRSTPG